MGLISKVKKAVGVVKNKSASALSGITKGKVSGVVKGAVKAVAAKKSTIGVVGAAGLLYKATKKIPGTFGYQVESVKKQLKKPFTKKSSAGMSTGKKVAIGAAVAAGAATIGYAVEQLAEKVGVRGGAGFIGKRRTRRKGKGRYAYIRVPRNRRGRGKLTRSEEGRLRSTARSYANSEGTSRRSRRKKGKRGSKSYMAWVRSFRRKK